MFALRFNVTFLFILYAILYAYMINLKPRLKSVSICYTFLVYSKCRCYFFIGIFICSSSCMYKL